MSDFPKVIDEALRSNLQRSIAETDLEGLMILTPETKTAEWVCEVLELEGFLPRTISWTNPKGLKVRLYETSKSFGSFELKHNRIHLRIEDGSEDGEMLPEPQQRLDDYQRSGGAPAMLEVKPATMPEKTLEFLRIMYLMDIWTPFSLPEDWSIRAMIQ